jgi:hypothetical protein
MAEVDLILKILFARGLFFLAIISGRARARCGGKKARNNS